MPKKSKASKMKIPNKLIALPNADKAFHEKWDDKRNMLNIPHPFRMLCLGPPNVGKSTVVKNLLIRAKPQFKEVVVIHCDAEYTKEYDDLGENVELLSSVPAPEEWEGLVKTLVVIDDMEFKGMNKEQKRNLDRLFGYCSTHKNISIILCSQDAFNVPCSCRRCTNVFVLWKSPDMDSMSGVARKTGMKVEEFKQLFRDVLPQFRDSLWIDMTSKTPYPLRKNGFEPIKMKNDE